jgi:predicted ATPase with chaperone activity
MLDESYEMETGVDLNCMSPAQEESYSKWVSKQITSARKILAERIHKLVPNVERMVEAIGNNAHTLSSRDIIRREYMIIGGLLD